MVKKYIICFIFITLFFNKNIFSYSQRALEKIEKNKSFWNLFSLTLFHDLDLSHADLSHAPLSYADLFCANLFSANLFSASLQYAYLQCADLQYADLYLANLQNSHLNETKFQNANLEEADLENTDLEDSDFENANLTKAILKKADLSKANFTNANLSYTKLHGAKIEGAIVTGANFRCTLGLTNGQKQYLRENGAINVPIDIEYEIDNSEVGHEEEELTLKKIFFGSFIKWYKRNCKSKNIGTQTEEIAY